MANFFNYLVSIHIFLNQFKIELKWLMELFVMHRFDYVVNQACQTKTTSRAANATKTDKKATKVFKKS